MSQSSYLVAQLNARLQPIHRGKLFEDPLNEALDRAALGQVTGGGTQQAATGEIEYCDIEIEITGQVPEAVKCVINTLENLGAPKGSKLHVEIESRQVAFGSQEGLAVYLNGTDLPDHVYRECDSNFVYREFGRLLEGSGRVLSFWQGPTETAFYAYGTSFSEMRDRLSDFVGSYPLCERCRVIQIA
jgi:hypothetical protein